jgi:hypothetical protein
VFIDQFRLQVSAIVRLEGFVHGLEESVERMGLLILELLNKSGTIFEGNLGEEGLDQTVLLALERRDVLGILLCTDFIDAEEALRVLDEGLVKGLEVESARGEVGTNVKGTVVHQGTTELHGGSWSHMLEKKLEELLGLHLEEKGLESGQGKVDELNVIVRGLGS